MSIYYYGAPWKGHTVLVSINWKGKTTETKAETANALSDTVADPGFPVGAPTS